MIDATVSFLVENQPWFAFALDLLLKSAALCLAALAIDRLCGRRGALARSLVLYTCLIGLTLLPAAELVFPQRRLQMWQGQETTVPGVQSVERGADQVAAVGPAAIERKAGSARRQITVTNAQSLAPVPIRAAGAVAINTSPVRMPVNWRSLALLGYAAVVAGAMVRLLLSLAAVARLQRAATKLTEAFWNDRLAHWRQRLNVSRSVRLLQSEQIDVPVVIGYRRPAIIVPERLATSDVQTVDAVMLHELAHVRRGDYGWNLLLRFVQAFYWANPLVWLVGLSIASVREQACDEVCIHWLGGAESYRATLLELANALLRRPLATLGMAMAGSSRLQRRLEQIDVSPGRAECQSRLYWRLAAIVVVATFAGALGGLKVARSAAASNEPEKSSTKKASHAEPADHHKVLQPAESGNADSTLRRQILGADPSTGEQFFALEHFQDPGGGIPEAEPIKVRVERVRCEDFVPQITQLGTLKAWRSTEHYARVVGVITARRVNTGDHVREGQVLAEIDAPEIDAELARAKALSEEAPAAVELAQGRLDEALAGSERAKADAVKSEAGLRRAANQLEFLKKVQRRLMNMSDQGLEQTQLEENEGEVQAAQGSVNVAKAELAAIKAAVQQAAAEVSVAKAGLRIAELHRTAAQQALKQVEQRAAFRQIVASATGVVVQQSAEPGSLAKLSGKPLFVIFDTQAVIMQTQIPAQDALRINPGDHARIWLDTEDQHKPRDSKVFRVGYAIDPKTRTMPVEIDLANTDDRMRPGMCGKVTIDLKTHAGALTTQQGVVLFDPVAEKSYCYRVVDGQAVKTEVVPGERNCARQEIIGGLSEGDLVIVAARRKIEDESRVEVVDSEK